MTRQVRGLHAWLADPDNLLFLALLLFHLAPLWAFPFFPSQDGPAHLENAAVLRGWGRPDLPLLRAFYTINPNPEPNWFGHVVLAGLMFVLPPLVAEKVLLSGYVILFPVCVRYALNAVRPGAGALAVLAFPFLPNFFFHLGFYNFCYGLAVFFLVVGYWIKHRDAFTWTTTALLAVLVTLLYFCHLVPLAAACLAVAVLAVWYTAFDFVEQARRGQRDWPALWKAMRARVLLPLPAFLPALLLAGLFLGRQGTATSEGVDLAQLAYWLRTLDALVSYQPGEGLFSTVLVGCFVAGLAYGLLVRAYHRHIDRSDGLLVVAAAFVAGYFLAPSGMAGGTLINDRLLLFPFFAVLLWFGALTYPAFLRRGKRGLQVAAVVCSLGLLVLHTATYVRLNAYLAEYTSGMALVEPNTTLLPLCFSFRGRDADNTPLTFRVGAFRHAAGWYAAYCRTVDLGNYEAELGYFPVRYRPEANPYQHIGTDDRLEGRGLEFEMPRVDFLTYPERTGQPVDYVLLWQLPPEHRDRPEVVSIFKQLEQGGYELIHTSRPRGLLQLYRRRGAAPAATWAPDAPRFSRPAAADRSPLAVERVSGYTGQRPMFDDLHHLRDDPILLLLLARYAEAGAADREAWHGRVAQLDSAPPEALVKLHGRLLACDWIEQNTGAAACCYRVTTAGRRALKQAQVCRAADEEELSTA